ncbi:IS66 family transposase [Nocardioides sp.]|uniref:IS66 family transposase n=1 Tax=Nocardioides sp. TaxID=35761 RepID=UPI003D0DC489
MGTSLERALELVKEETNPEVLRALSLMVIQENDRLLKVIDQIEKDKAARDQARLNIEEDLKLLRRKLFGRSEDKREGQKESREKSQEDAQLFSQAAFPAPEEPKSQKDKWRGVPESKFQHGLNDTDLKKESELRGLESPSASQWEEIPGAFDTVTRIQIVERSYIKEVHQKKKYRLKDEFNPDAFEKDVIVTAPGPDALLPGMNYSTEVVAATVADKYVSHIPLDRQVRMMASLGLAGMRTSTLSRFCALGAASLEEMAERIKAELIREASNVALHLDETPWRIQDKDQKDGYMWVISNRLGSYYFFKPSRSGKAIQEKLEGLNGVVLTDGYSGYNILEEAGIAQGYCWAHARRKFLPVEHDDPGVMAILDDIDELFAIEREARTFEQLKKLRDERSGLITKRLRQALMSEYPKSRPKSQKRKALEYLLERWDGFTLFLTDIRLPLSNNEAERTIRHAVMGRKNFYGSNNHTGAETAATLYTIIESAKKNDLDPRAFILMSLKRIAAGNSVMTPLEYAQHIRVPATTPTG